MADRTVVATVPSEAEADIVCGLLRAHGVECAYRHPDIAQQGFWGWREVVVAASDAETARALLSTQSEKAQGSDA